MAGAKYRISVLEWRRQRGMQGPGSTTCGKKTFRWGQRTYVMGIINTSPDSFSGDGLDTAEKAIAQAYRFIAEGADFLDIGGESTRPGSAAVTAAAELQRVLPVVRALAHKIEVPISVDTYKPAVAEAVLGAGAEMINDIWALKHDASLARVVARKKVPIILISNQRDKEVRRIVPEVILDLKRAIDLCLDAGIARENIIVDPGIGFGKKLEQNYELIRRLDELKVLGRPILLGASRKSMIGQTLNLPENQRLEGTAASNVIGILKGADIIRVHDVKEMLRVARMTDAILGRQVQ